LYFSLRFGTLRNGARSAGVGGSARADALADQVKDCFGHRAQHSSLGQYVASVEWRNGTTLPCGRRVRRVRVTPATVGGSAGSRAIQPLCLENEHGAPPACDYDWKHWSARDVVES
jgi:hypothetical protein